MDSFSIKNLPFWYLEGLEHDLYHLFSAGLRTQKRLGHKHSVVFGGDLQFIVDAVVPDFSKSFQFTTAPSLNGIVTFKEYRRAAACLPPRNGGKPKAAAMLAFLGWPMTFGKTARGQASPATPTLLTVEPMSMTTAG